MIHGQCLCGAVRFHLTGAARDVTVCHCSVCRRLHGGAAAYSASPSEAFHIDDDADLRWHDVDGAHYGFCSTCGSRMFWKRDGWSHTSFNAALLVDAPPLMTTHHIWVGSAGAYEDLSTSLPCHLEGSDSARREPAPPAS